MSYLHTDGKWLRDSLGRTVKLRGVAKMCMEFSNYHEIPSYNITERDFENIKSLLHSNVIRIDLALSLLFPTFDVSAPDSTYLSHMDNIVKWCGERGMRVIFDLHGYYTQMEFPADFWTQPAWERTGIAQPYRDQIRDFWIFIANRYDGNRIVVGFDLLNEPWNCVPAEDRPFPDEWKLQIEEWIDAIVAVNPRLLFFVENAGHQAWGSNDWRWLETAPVNRSNVVYSPHFYPQNLDGSWSDYSWMGVTGSDFAQDYAAGNYEQAKIKLREFLKVAFPVDRPVYVGEFAAPILTVSDPAGLQYLEDFLSIMDEPGFNHINYTYWAWVAGSSPTYALVDHDWVTMYPQGHILAEYLLAPEPSLLRTVLGAGLGVGVGYIIGGEFGATGGLFLGGTFGRISSYIPPALTSYCEKCGRSFMFTTYGSPVWCSYCGEEQIVEKEGVK